MRSKAFTLIELLVVVAIIGILAAVGVVAYNGYTNAAKKNAIKQNFKLVQSFASAELIKCELGETYIFSNSGSNKVPCGAIDQAYRTEGGIVSEPSLRFLNPIDNGVWNRNDQRAVRSEGWLGKSIPDDWIGYIYIDARVWPIKMRSCFQTPCNNNSNILNTTLNYQ